MANCPFFPTEINPCAFHDCQFLCTGGCAISLAAYSHDAFKNTKEIKDRVDNLSIKLNIIEHEINNLKQQLR